MHEHTECEHVVKYCKHCDVCYCEKCGREWGKEKIRIVKEEYPRPWKPWREVTWGDRDIPNPPVEITATYDHRKCK